MIHEEHRRSEKKQESKNSEVDVFYSKEKQKKRRKNGNYTVKCYNCNKMGHISKDCIYIFFSFLSEQIEYAQRASLPMIYILQIKYFEKSL